MPRRSVARLLSPDASTKRVLGIDPSLASTGWAFREGKTLITGHIDSQKLRGPWRLHYVATEVEKVVERCRPDLVVYEDYAMGKAGKGGLVFHIGELGGVLKRMLWWRGINVMMVSPTVLKKVITGKGNPGWTPKGVRKLTTKQKKQVVVDALLADFSIRTPQHDEADAAGLMVLGEIRCGVFHDSKNALTSIRNAAVIECEIIRGRLQSIAN